MTTTYIYKIAPASPEPSHTDDKASDTSSEPVLPPSGLDVSSNFIHMSTASQIEGTLRNFFPTSTGERNVVYLLKVASQPLEAKGVVRWESPDAKICGPRDGEGMFPHLYFDEPTDAGGKVRRLWLKRNEVENIAEVVSESGSTSWDEGLRELQGWLV